MNERVTPEAAGIIPPGQALDLTRWPPEKYHDDPRSKLDKQFQAINADTTLSNRARLDAYKALAPLVDKGEQIAVAGAGGQIGTKLGPLLEELYPGQVVYCDFGPTAKARGFKSVDVTDTNAVGEFIKEENVKVLINLAALLSGAAEKTPDLALAVNLWASLDMMRYAKEWGLRKSAAMSSIARVEHGFRVFDDPTTVRAKAEAQEHSNTTLNASPTGSYGQQKATLEDTADLLSRHHEIEIQTPRLAGVLNCHRPWPANGTTEELDKMILAAAYQAVYGDKAEEKIIENVRKIHGDKAADEVKADHLFDRQGAYVPKVPMSATFNMVDGDTLPEAVLLLLHRDMRGRPGLPGGPGDGAVHNVAEYSVSMEAAAKQLETLNPEFKVRFPTREEQDYGKTHRAGIWPLSSETGSTEALIGNFKTYDAEKSIATQYQRAVEELTHQKVQEEGIHAEHNGNGHQGNGGHAARVAQERASAPIAGRVAGS